MDLILSPPFGLFGIKIWSVSAGNGYSVADFYHSMVPPLKPLPCDQLHNCSAPNGVRIVSLLSSFLLISVGAGCIRPCSIAFGAGQFDNKKNPNNERVIQSYFNWYYASATISTVVAMTVIVYIQDRLGWSVGFGIPAILMLSLL